MDYFNRHEEFSPESMALTDWTDMAQKNVSHGTPQTCAS